MKRTKKKIKKEHLAVVSAILVIILATSLILSYTAVINDVQYKKSQLGNYSVKLIRDVLEQYSESSVSNVIISLESKDNCQENINDIISILSENDFTVRYTFTKSLCGFSGYITFEGLKRIISDPRVKVVESNKVNGHAFIGE